MPGVKPILIFSVCMLAFGLQSYAQTDSLSSDSVISLVEKQVQANKTRHTHSARSPNNAWLITPYYTALIPVGILSQRFGFSNDVGMDISYKVRGDWTIGVEGDYLFGSHVKEDPITNSIGTYTAPTQIIGLDGTLLTPTLELSGFEIAFKVGKLISFTRKHPNSGIVISLAPGYIQHKIQITANTNNFPQLDPTYKKGYDRLTSGGMVEAYLGYMFLERKKFLSFTAGIDFTAGLTQERRNWDFDLMSSNTGTRLDMLIGFKVGWIIPVFTNKDNQAYY